MFTFNVSRGYAQNFSCLDSVQTILYGCSSFQPTKGFGSIAVKDGGTVIFQNIPGATNQAIVFKASSNGTAAWSRNINEGNALLWDTIREMQDGALLLSTPVYSPFPGNLGSNQLLLDAAGNFLWQGDYNNQDNDTGIQVINSGPTGTLIWAGKRNISNTNGITVGCYDYINQAVTWRRNYSVSSTTTAFVTLSNIFVLNGSVYIGGIYIGTSAAGSTQGCWVLQLDYATGNVIKFISYSLADMNAGASDFLFSGTSKLMSFGGNRFIFAIDMSNAATQQKEVALVQLEDKLSLRYAPVAISSPLAGIGNTFCRLNTSGSGLFFIEQPGRMSGYFAVIDSTNTITRQFTSTNTNANALTQYNFTDYNAINSVIPVQQGGNLYFGLTTLVEGFLTENTCLSVTDTSFAVSRLLSTNPADIGWVELGPFPRINIVSPAVRPLIDVITSSSTLCKNKSVCDSVKINGRNEFCSGDTVFTFTATKNVACNKRISWFTDTAFVSIPGQANDTTINVRFNKAGKSYIVAAVAGCNIADTLLMTIHGKTGFELGNDTTVCPGTVLVLNPHADAVSYLWQDGSMDSLYTVTGSGKYSLSIRDQCNNTSADTIVVNYLQQQVSPVATVELCSNVDTVLTANPGFATYAWQPSSAIKSDPDQQSIHISPGQSIMYIVTATTANPACTFSDTVQVSVKNCLNKLLMPNAFTPDGNGINDLISPVIFGYVEKYEFFIYNRWGQTVFHSTLPNQGWNGTVGGKAQMTGTYIWVCRYQFTGTEERVDRGSFILVR